MLAKRLEKAQRKGRYLQYKTAEDSARKFQSIHSRRIRSRRIKMKVRTTAFMTRKGAFRYRKIAKGQMRVEYNKSMLPLMTYMVYGGIRKPKIDERYIIVKNPKFKRLPNFPKKRVMIAPLGTGIKDGNFVYFRGRLRNTNRLGIFRKKISKRGKYGKAELIGRLHKSVKYKNKDLVYWQRDVQKKLPKIQEMEFKKNFQRILPTIR